MTLILFTPDLPSFITHQPSARTSASHTETRSASYGWDGSPLAKYSLEVATLLPPDSGLHRGRAERSWVDVLWSSVAQEGTFLSMLLRAVE